MASGGSRPGAGRKRKDPKLKALAGTLRKDRDEPAAQLPVPAGTGVEPMICPMHLSDLAQLIFGELASLLEKQRRSAPEYAQHVALLAQRLEQVQRFQAVLEISGDTYESKTIKKVGEETVISTMIRARPEVAMLSDAMRQAQSLIGELMLNPSSALRIASGHKREPGAFDEF
jgi:phage terminase small subunit